MFDLALLLEFAVEVGLPHERLDANGVALDVGVGARLVFANLPANDDTLVTFEPGQDWHTHGDMYAQDPTELALLPVDIVQRMLAGQLLVSVFNFGDHLEYALIDAREPPELRLEPGERRTFIRIPQPGRATDAELGA